MMRNIFKLVISLKGADLRSFCSLREIIPLFYGGHMADSNVTIFQVYFNNKHINQL